MPTLTRPRNDPAQYDDLVGEWWDPFGTFAMLHWIAEARARLVPPATRPGALLVDLGCGGGLLAPHVARLGYTHVGLDLTRSALLVATDHGVLGAQADASALPLPTGIADVVACGELLEHTPAPAAVVREACRILRPGGTLVVDTIAATALARFVVVWLAERVPGAAPPGLHDPALFVDRAELRRAAAAGGVHLHLTGLRPSLLASIGWLTRRHATARMVPSRFTSVLFQGTGTKPPAEAGGPLPGGPLTGGPLTGATLPGDARP